MNKKPPIISVASAAEELIVELELLGYGTRTERSNASNASVYVYAFNGHPSELKIRVSNHALSRAARWRHRTPDFELILPNGRINHVVEQIKARLRANPPPPTSDET